MDTVLFARGIHSATGPFHRGFKSKKKGFILGYIQEEEGMKWPGFHYPEITPWDASPPFHLDFGFQNHSKCEEVRRPGTPGHVWSADSSS